VPTALIHFSFITSEGEKRAYAIVSSNGFPRLIWDPLIWKYREHWFGVINDTYKYRGVLFWNERK